MCYTKYITHSDNNIFYKVYDIEEESYFAPEIFLKLRNLSETNHCFILESAANNPDFPEDGRWSFIGWDPLLEISLNNERYTQRNLRTGDTTTEQITDPNAKLSAIMQEHYIKPDVCGYFPPFFGGLMGYFSFEYIKYFEPRLAQRFNTTENTEEFNDMDFMLFDKVVAIDNIRREMYIILTTFGDESAQNRLSGNMYHEIEQIYQHITNDSVPETEPLKIEKQAEEMFTEAEFAEIVNSAQVYINNGDIFQVVVSNRIKYNTSGSLYDVYLRLRANNPSPYMFYLTSDSIEIAGASPETLVDLKYTTFGERDDFRVVHTYPLAGTRPRGKSPEEDIALEQELLADEKERTEHNMLVDLGRNDIGKVAKFGSVKVQNYMEVLRFTNVMHIGSKVEGKLRDDLTAFDLIPAVLPAGTLSGAPKIRACEIINELEGDSRGIYGGCLGYFSLDGQMDMCITIRSAYLRNGALYARSGAGIVLDSVAHSEFVETQNKIKSVVNAIDGDDL